MKKRKINSTVFAKRKGAYSHGYVLATSDARIIFTTGQMALDNLGKIAYPQNVRKQVALIFESLNLILKAEGASLDDVIKATIYLTDMKDFREINETRNIFLGKSEPVFTCVEVKRLLVKGARVQIEVIAVCE